MLKPYTVSLPMSVYKNSPVTNGQALSRRLQLTDSLPMGWTVASNSTCITLYKVLCTTQQPPGVVTNSLMIYDDLTWTLSIGSTTVLPTQIPSALSTLHYLQHLVDLTIAVDRHKLCVGNPEEKYFCLTRHGNLYDQSGTKVIARMGTTAHSSSTIRHSECKLLLLQSADSDRCIIFQSYRRTLNKALSRKSVCKSTDTTTPHSHTNLRYLGSPEKTVGIKELQHSRRLLQRRITHLMRKLGEATDVHGVCLDADISSDLEEVIKQEDVYVMERCPKDSFLHLFWQQQKEALTKNPKGMRWHPVMIRWCLYLRHQSSKAYNLLRETGIALPSQRTLRDYTHCFKAATGFQKGADEQLLLASRALTCEEWQKYVVLLIDEMYIREDLVYDKHTGNLVGYTNLGEVNNHLLAFERSIYCNKTHPLDPAKSMLVFMVKGLFTNLKYPYAQFSCIKLTGECLFQLFWEAVKQLERLGLRVLAATLDGASNNRKMIKLHNRSASLTYKVKNIYASDKPRDLFFISDPPHLLKTARNCLASKCRFMWCNGKDISWQHLIDLYERDMGKASGLAILPKLKYEHVHLTSFSKMRVDLAAQVLSESVSKALELVGGSKSSETARFTSYLDKFFDALNVSNFVNGKKERKPFKDPYRSSGDFRITWLQKDFLGYLDDWETSVNRREGFTDVQKSRMMLSAQTLLGLRMTTLSFIGIVQFVFSLPEAREKRLTFLSNSLCQDPLEQFFGCRRQRGGTSDNPNVLEFCQNTQALRVVDSFCRGPVRGNCRKRNQAADNFPTVDKENMLPLTKRPRKH